MIKLKPNEVVLKGSWVLNDSIVEIDNVTKRIEWLISHSLREVATDETGWNKLYQDQDDKRYWELIYHESDQHGGGVPELKCISSQEVENKYQI